MGWLEVQAAGVLRAQGGRMTAQRRLILNTLDSMGGHPTAEQVYTAVARQNPTINPSTVYRTLAWLANAGLVSPLRLGARRQPGSAEQYDPALPAEHHHFVCTGCGSVTEFTSAAVDAAKRSYARHHGAAVERGSLTLYGTCARCRTASEPEALGAGRPERSL